MSATSRSAIQRVGKSKCFRVEIVALREDLFRLNRMLAVVEACATAGISYPIEVSDFFGGTLKAHGPDVSKLRADMQRVCIPTYGDLYSADGVTIRLDDLPRGTSAVCIRVFNRDRINDSTEDDASSNLFSDDKLSVGAGSSHVELIPEVEGRCVNLVAGDSNAITLQCNVLSGETTSDFSIDSHSETAQLETDASNPLPPDDDLEFALDSSLWLLASGSDVLAEVSDLELGSDSQTGCSDVLSGDSATSWITDNASGPGSGNCR